MRLGIRYRLLLPLGLLLLGVVGASLWSARVAARRAEDRVARQVRNVSTTIRSANFALTPVILEQMKSLSGAEFLVIASDGSQLTTFGVGLVDRPPNDDVFVGTEHAIGPLVRVNGELYRCRRLDLREPTPNAGGVAYIFYPEALLDEAIADARQPALLGLVFGLLAVGLTFGIANRLVGRIHALERRTRQIAAGDFSPMPLPQTNDELRDLSVSVNEMADRLARLQLTVQRTERLQLSGQLASGLAHQLRNGVTGARLAVQVYLDDHPNGDTEALAVTLRQLALMETNLRRLIDLGRPAEPRRGRHSLTRTITDVVELHRPHCQHVGIALHWDPTVDVTVDGDSNQLTDLFANVIANAIEAVGSNGVVEIDLQQMGSVAVVEVRDSGPGPPAEVSNRVFEPFVTGKPEGIGLGLAVARYAAAAHGGTIDWSRKGDWTVFRMELPVAVDGGLLNRAVASRSS